jgi:YbbR domain-containing protein
MGYEKIGLEFEILKNTITNMASKGVKSVIENISKDDIIAYVDLAGLGVGTHNVQVQIEKSDVKVDYVPKKTTVSIQITKK